MKDERQEDETAGGAAMRTGEKVHAAMGLPQLRRTNRGGRMCEKPRPCPFCGSRAYVWNELGYNVDGGITASAMLWFVGCKGCPAVMGAREKDAVITAWNRRIEVSE